ncbi:MAG: hypothetical protein ACYC8S_01705 [Minisyncoccota bacterium]
MNSQKFVESKSFRRALWIFAVLAAVCIIFEAGVIVGYHKAGFSYEWGDNYYQIFGGNPFSLDSDIGLDGPTVPRGVTGKVLSVTPTSMIVSGQDGTEKLVMITDDTLIRYQRDDVLQNTLMPGDRVVVIGQPTANGKIDAQLIRIIERTTHSISAATTTTSVR